ncbi:KpsF/GutQ family sugar-phosphate isomerase [bacterium AH-315-C07]|nr:KpsF/GutQ family sugar-phosphate isomerase [bacterium AH-315-C07]
MRSEKELRDIAIRTLELESEAIRNLVNYINDDFLGVIKLIYESSGRVVVTGIGKSANIAKKIVATFNSTGTRSIFMHAADAVHGDLGMIQSEDVIICISKSGETPEIKLLMALLKNAGNKLVAMVGNPDSYLAKQANFVLNTYVEKEACPNNLAPTTSTTAQLAMGDALAICLMESKGFTSEHFAKYHPGGSLGKKLYLRVSDIYVQNEKPEVKVDDDIKSVILEITSKRLGNAVVLDGDEIVGVVTDGDIRRMLEQDQDMKSLTAKDIMSPNPKCIDKDELAVKALELIQENKITNVIVAENGIYLGIVHIHDLIREGIL